MLGSARLSAGDAARFLKELERGETSGPAVAALEGMLQAAPQKLSHIIFCSSIENRTLHSGTMLHSPAMASCGTSTLTSIVPTTGK